MPLTKPDAPRAVFERSPLTLVVCQVQFEAILSIAQPESVAPFQEGIRSDYPRVGRVGSVQLTIGPEGFDAKPTTSTAWAFETVDAQWRVVLDTNSLAIEAKQYTRYEDLRDRYRNILNTFLATFGQTERTRLGLRYINQIRIESGENVATWRAVVRPELLGLALNSALTDDENVMHTMGQTRLAQDESQMMVRYGLMPPGLPVAGVEPLDTHYFLIDLDDFDVRRFSSIDIDQTLGQLDSFHGDIHRTFRWMLTDEGAKQLGVSDEIKA